MKNLIFISSLFVALCSNAQDLRDHLVGEYVGYIITRGISSGNIDTVTNSWKYYLLKSPLSDSLYLKQESPNHPHTNMYVVHSDTSFSWRESDNGRPYSWDNICGFLIGSDSLYYQRFASGGGGGGEPHTIEFYGKKTDWIGIDEYKQEHEISLYPNPFNNELNIKSTQEIEQVLVHNLEGKTQLRISPKQKAFILPLSQLNNGVYFIELHTGNGIVLKKVLKK